MGLLAQLGHFPFHTNGLRDVDHRGEPSVRRTDGRPLTVTSPFGDPGLWIVAVERIGVLNSAVLIGLLSAGVGFVFRGPALLKELNRSLEIVLLHKRELERIRHKIRREQAELKAELSKRKQRIGRRRGPHP